ncbi:hypothetical protein NDN01_10055 [Sphingomonas sp. QA11]|uniref:hypothetical protein n=1 Tax=Sphingomonas sp. QA11 TaxID=2950605 RepID=UPI00234B3199|nr:hypothetical protein [Sphingomonas sp. QA11]WCM29197.1 hypothetical protein NDN01_10055 [Sphingomonas sp. QA11]
MSKIPALPEVLAPTGNEDVVIHSGGRAKRTKLIRIIDTIMGAGAAVAARDKAQKWAEENEDVAVEPGKFSARHWALKSASSAAVAIAQVAASAGSAAAAYASQIASAASAAVALAAMNTATALFNATGPNAFYRSYAAMVAAFATAPNKSTADVYPDSTRSNRATRYLKDTAINAGAWIFVRYVDTPPTYYCDSKYGDDNNDGLTPDTPKKSLAAIQTATSGLSGVSVGLARGGHWRGEFMDLQNTRWGRIFAYGQGKRPMIDGAANMFPGVWLKHTTYANVWYQPFTMPMPTGGSGPGDENRWHLGLWDQAPAIGPGTDTRSSITRMAEGANGGWIKRVLNGDPHPDPATFDNEKVYSTVLAMTSQDEFLAILNAHTNTFAVFPATGGYEPNDGVPRTAFVAYVRLADDSNPNTNGRTLLINRQYGLAGMGKGMDCSDVIFCRSGGKDMISGYQFLPVPPHNPSDDGDIFSGNFHRCSFWEAGAHGPVVCGMSFYDCDYIGHYMRDSYKGGCGAYHNFRSAGGVNKGRGYEIVRCKAKRFGYLAYGHGGGDGSDGQNEVCHLDTIWADDGRAIAVGGTTSQGYWCRNVVARDVDSCGASSFPETTYENCVFIMRNTGANSIGGAGSIAAVYPTPRVGRARFVNSLVISLGPTLALPMGSQEALTLEQYPSLVLERSTIWGNITAQTNPFWRQLNITMDRHSYLGVFNSLGSGDTNTEVYPTGSIVAKGPDGAGNFGSIIECVRTPPETIRAAFAGIEAGVETGIVRQLWQWTVQQNDIVYVPPQSAVSTGTTGWINNGDGTATIPTSFNFGSSNLGRAVKIALGNGATDYFGAIVSVPDNGSIVVRPLPTAPITTAKALSVGYFRPFPFRDAVTAYISTDGTQLNLPSASGFAVGQYVRVGNILPGQPGYGVRKIVGLNGTIATFDKPCPWKQRQNFVAYRSIATPTTGTGRTLPTVQLSWGFPIQARILVHASFIDPRIVITKAEGGADIVMEQSLVNSSGVFIQSGLFSTAFNSSGNAASFANADYEAGYWAQAVSLAAGDIMKLYCLVDVQEMRLAFNTPPELGGYSPANTCLLSQRRIGYRPSI